METLNYRYNILSIDSIEAFVNIKGGYNNCIRDVYFIRAVGEPQNIQSLIEDTDRQMDKEAANNRLKYGAGGNPLLNLGNCFSNISFLERVHCLSLCCKLSA